MAAAEAAGGGEIFFIVMSCVFRGHGALFLQFAVSCVVTVLLSRGGGGAF